MTLQKIDGLDNLSVVHKIESQVYCVSTYGNYNEITKVFVFKEHRTIEEINIDELLLKLIGPNYQRIQRYFSTGLEHFSIQRDTENFIYVHFYQEWDIYKFSNDGILIDKIPIDFSEGHTCYDVKIELPDKLWLTFPTGHTIAKLDLTTHAIQELFGKFEWLDTSSENNEFLAYPESIWIDNKSLYIPNMGNGKLFRKPLHGDSLILDCQFDEALWIYFTVGVHEYVKLESGTFHMVR